MFPALRFSVHGLNPSKEYVMAVEICSFDNFRYKYNDAEWCITGKAYPDTLRAQRYSIHPDSPSSGAKWTSNIVSFHKLKITNNVNGSPKHVRLVKVFYTMLSLKSVLKNSKSIFQQDIWTRCF